MVNAYMRNFPERDHVKDQFWFMQPWRAQPSSYDAGFFQSKDCQEDRTRPILYAVKLADLGLPIPEPIDYDYWKYRTHEFRVPSNKVVSTDLDTIVLECAVLQGTATEIEFVKKAIRAAPPTDVAMLHHYFAANPDYEPRLSEIQWDTPRSTGIQKSKSIYAPTGAVLHGKRLGILHQCILVPGQRTDILTWSISAPRCSLQMESCDRLHGPRTLQRGYKMPSLR